MAWIEVHQSLRDHRKILALADLLDMPEPHVAGHCLYLWLWSLDNAPDGVLPTSRRIIARAAAWTGETNRFVDALIDVGMVDVAEDGTLSIHDWDDYAGKIIDRRERNKNAMREARARDKVQRVQHVDTTSETRDATCKATVPNPTLPYSTVTTSSGISSSGNNGFIERENAANATALLRPRSQKAKTQKPEKRETIPKEPKEPRPRNPLWDALEAGLDFHPTLPGECTNMGKVVRDLQHAGATPEEIPLRIARYVARYGRERLTLNALHNHWSECATDPVVTNNSHNGGQLDEKARNDLAAAREDAKRKRYEETMRLAREQAALDDQQYRTS